MVLWLQGKAAGFSLDGEKQKNYFIEFVSPVPICPVI